MDHRLAIGARLEETLTERILNSSLLLIVLSPAYLRSAWGAWELESFLAAAAKEPTGTSSRVFVVEYDRVERPDALKNVISASFWEADPDNPDHTLTLSVLRPQPKEERADWYSDRRDFLAQDLGYALARLKQAGQTTQNAAPVSVIGSRARVFLAKAPLDVFDTYVKVRKTLMDEKFEVVPRDDFPDDEARFREKVREDLASSSLFVQFLGVARGVVLSGSGLPRVVVQHELAREAGIDMLRWRDRIVDLKEVDGSAPLAAPDVLG
jgi:hypothetical protein